MEDKITEIIEETIEEIIPETTEVQEETPTIEEELPKEKSTKRSKRQSKEKQTVKELNISKEIKINDPKDFKIGDAVRISSKVGLFTNGHYLSPSFWYTTLYVNKVSGDIVELKNNSGHIVGSLRKSCITKVKK